MKMSRFFGGLPIRKDEKRILGKKVKYSLYTVRRPCTCFYIIEVADAEESHARCFGKEKSAALEMYERIVACSVTPCTLGDIADDFAAEQKLIG